MQGTLAVGLLFSVAACSSSSKGSSGGLSAAQQALLAESQAEAKAEGATIDVDCITKVIAKMSDADAKAIVAAGPGGNPTVSEAGQALGAEAAKCVKASAETTAS